MIKINIWTVKYLKSHRQICGEIFMSFIKVFRDKLYSTQEVYGGHKNEKKNRFIIRWKVSGT